MGVRLHRGDGRLLQGSLCEGRTEGVGDAVNQAVVITFILIFFANFIMTSLYLALVPQKF